MRRVRFSFGSTVGGKCGSRKGRESVGLPEFAGEQTSLQQIQEDEQLGLG
jgi:hypothetical protein